MPPAYAFLLSAVMVTAGQAAPATSEEPPAANAEPADPIDSSFATFRDGRVAPVSYEEPAPASPEPADPVDSGFATFSADPSARVPYGQRAEVGSAPSTPRWPEVWGVADMKLVYAGRRTAPNGELYDPLFDLDLDLNIGLLPNKLLYLFVQPAFWGERATAGQTHGNLDFTKREFDITFGGAVNYYGPLEFRVFGYGNNNLNRGISPLIPSGYDDGMGFENRWYLPTDNPYDIGRLSFLSIGYLPNKTLTGNNGAQFRPGFTARAYLAYDLPWWRSYLYGDGQLICESAFNPRLLPFDAGWAVRPFTRLDGLEFRLGGTDTYDFRATKNEELGYVALRFLW